MRRKLMIVLAGAVGFLAIGGPLLAHHGVAAYDMVTPVTLKATVTKFAWENPHVEIYFDATDDNGKVVHWRVETLSLEKMVRSGWTRESLKAGDQIVATFGRAKNGSPLGFLIKLAFADGRQLRIPEAPSN
jgi:Family of unknown function (DUF6152)